MKKYYFSRKVLIVTFLLAFSIFGARLGKAQVNGDLFFGEHTSLRLSHDFDIVGSFTVEAWVKPASETGVRTLISSADPGDPAMDYGFAVKLLNGNQIQCAVGDANGYAVRLTADFDYQRGTWYHIAVAVVGDSKCVLYVDGNKIAEEGYQWGGAILQANNYWSYINRAITFGSYGGTKDFFYGEMDELRIWNTGRSESQIRETMYDPLSGTENNLVFYNDLHFYGDGLTDMAPAQGLQTVTSQGISPTYWNRCYSLARPAITGVTNRNTSGFTFSWTEHSSSISRYQRGHKVEIATDSTFKSIVKSDPNVSWAANSYTVTGLSGNTTYYCRVRTIFDNQTAPFSAAKAIATSPPPGNALTFDGVDDYLNVSQGNISAPFTVETWVKPMEGEKLMAILSSRIGAEHGFDLKLLKGNKIHCDIGHGRGWITTTATAEFNYEKGLWLHVAVVVTKSGYQIFANGNQVGSGTYYAPFEPLLMDQEHQLSYGRAYGMEELFNGQMDELRIWNTARSKTEIQGNMYKPLYGTESGLVFYHSLDLATGTSFYNMAGEAETQKVSMKNMGDYSWTESYAMVCPQLGTITTDPVNNLVTWTAPQIGKVDNYVVEVAKDENFTQDLQAFDAGTGTSYSIPGLSGNTQYFCRLRANKSSVSGTGAVHYTGAKSFFTVDKMEAPGNALNFDGTDEYVNCGNPTSLQFGSNDFTIEAWIKTTSTATRVAIGKSSNTGDYWLGNNDNGHAVFSMNGSGITSTTKVNDGKWHHIATVQSSGSRFLYVDGKLDGTGTGQVFPSGADLTIGCLSASAGYYFDGQVDEVRLWGAARSQDDIRGAMYNELNANESGLKGYYNFNQSTGNQLYDLTKNNHGTLQNTDGNNWQESYAMVCSDIADLTAINPTKFRVNWYKPKVGLIDNYLVEIATDKDFTANAQSFNAGADTTYMVSGIASGTTYFCRVRANKKTADGTGGLYYAAKTITTNTEMKAPGNALSFDGFSKYVKLPNESTFDFTNAMTVQFWMKLGAFSTPRQAIITKGDNAWRIERYASTSKIAFGSNDASGTAHTEIVSVSDIEPNKWYFVTLRYDGAKKQLYLNGKLEAEAIATGDLNNNDVPVAIGGNLQSTGMIRYFEGQIDEVRIWNTAVHPAYLDDYMTRKPTDTNGVVAYYNFDQTGGNQLNDHENVHNGILVGIGAQDWRPSYAMVCPSVKVVYNYGATGFEIYWYDSQVGSAEKFIIEAATDDKFTQNVKQFNGGLSGSFKNLTVKSGLLPGTKYNFRVLAASDSLGIGAQNPEGGSRRTITTINKMAAPGNALSFDGADDYVSVGRSEDILGSFTVEAWVKPMDATTDMPIISTVNTNGDNAHGFSLNISGGNTLHCEIGDGSQWLNQNLKANFNYAAGVWYHIAVAVYPRGCDMYINGRHAAHASLPSGTPALLKYYDLREMFYGKKSGKLFKGELDEVRVWNSIRSQRNIIDNMHEPLTGAEPDLLVYHDFDYTEGTEFYDLATTSANAETGILKNMSNANWAPSYAMARLELANASDLVPAGFKVTWTAPTLVSVNNYVLEVSTDSNFTHPIEFDAGTAKSKTATGLSLLTTYYYRVRGNGTGGSIYSAHKSITTPRSQMTGAGNALSLDGKDEYVVLPYGSELAATDNWTLEFWVKPETVTSNRSVPIISNGFFQWEVGISADSHLYFYTGYQGGSITYPVALKKDFWYHVAVSYENGLKKLYVNGRMEVSGKVASLNKKIENGLHIGHMEGNSYTPLFNGKIDDVRIWNSVRTEDQINKNMATGLLGTENGLIAYYNFDQENGSTLPDLAPAGGTQNGSLINIEDTDWSSSFAMIVPTAIASPQIEQYQFIAKWNRHPSAAADSFILDVAKDPGFTQKVLDGRNLDKGFVGAWVIQLDINTKYYYRMHIAKNGEFSAYSNTIGVVTSTLKEVKVTEQANTKETAWNLPLAQQWSLTTTDFANNTGIVYKVLNDANTSLADSLKKIYATADYKLAVRGLKDTAINVDIGAYLRDTLVGRGVFQLTVPGIDFTGVPNQVYAGLRYRGAEEAKVSNGNLVSTSSNGTDTTVNNQRVLSFTDTVPGKMIAVAEKNGLYYTDTANFAIAPKVQCEINTQRTNLATGLSNALIVNDQFQKIYGLTVKMIEWDITATDYNTGITSKLTNQGPRFNIAEGDGYSKLDCQLTFTFSNGETFSTYKSFKFEEKVTVTVPDIKDTFGKTVYVDVNVMNLPEDYAVTLRLNRGRKAFFPADHSFEGNRLTITLNRMVPWMGLGVVTLEVVSDSTQQVIATTDFNIEVVPEFELTLPDTIKVASYGSDYASFAIAPESDAVDWIKNTRPDEWSIPLHLRDRYTYRAAIKTASGYTRSFPWYLPSTLYLDKSHLTQRKYFGSKTTLTLPSDFSNMGPATLTVTYYRASSDNFMDIKDSTVIAYPIILAKAEGLPTIKQNGVQASYAEKEPLAAILYMSKGSSIYDLTGFDYELSSITATDTTLIESGHKNGHVFQYLPQKLGDYLLTIKEYITSNTYGEEQFKGKYEAKGAFTFSVKEQPKITNTYWIHQDSVGMQGIKLTGYKKVLVAGSNPPQWENKTEFTATTDANGLVSVEMLSNTVYDLTLKYGTASRTFEGRYYAQASTDTLRYVRDAVTVGGFSFTGDRVERDERTNTYTITNAVMNSVISLTGTTLIEYPNAKTPKVTVSGEVKMYKTGQSFLSGPSSKTFLIGAGFMVPEGNTDNFSMDALCQIDMFSPVMSITADTLEFISYPRFPWVLGDYMAGVADDVKEETVKAMKDEIDTDEFNLLQELYSVAKDEIDAQMEDDEDKKDDKKKEDDKTTDKKKKKKKSSKLKSMYEFYDNLSIPEVVATEVFIGEDDGWEFSMSGLEVEFAGIGLSIDTVGYTSGGISGVESIDFEGSLSWELGDKKKKKKKVAPTKTRGEQDSVWTTEQLQSVIEELAASVNQTQGTDSIEIEVVDASGKVIFKNSYDEFADISDQIFTEDLRRGLPIESIGIAFTIINGKIDAFKIEVEGEIPIPSTPVVLNRVMGSVSELTETDEYGNTSYKTSDFLVTLECDLGFKSTDLLTVDSLRIQIRPFSYFAGSGYLSLQGNPIAWAGLSYNNNKKLFKAVAWANLYGCLTGQLGVSIQGGSVPDFTGYGRLDASVPGYIPWFGGTHLGYMEAGVNKTLIAGRAYVEIDLWLKTLTFSGGLGYHFVDKKVLWGSNITIPTVTMDLRRGDTLVQQFVVKEDTRTLMVLANNPNKQEVNFVLKDPAGKSVITAENYGYSKEHQFTIAFIEIPAQGTWTVEVDEFLYPDVKLEAMIIDNAPTGYFVSPTEQDLNSTEVAMKFNDTNDTLNVEVFYDDDRQGYDGLKIAEFKVENNASLKFNYSGEGLLPGEYFFYYQMTDASGIPTMQYAPGSLLIEGSEDTPAPENLKYEFSGDSLIVSWAANDTAYVSYISLTLTDQATGKEFVRDYSIDSVGCFNKLADGHEYTLTAYNVGYDYSKLQKIEGIKFNDGRANKAPVWAGAPYKDIEFVTGTPGSFKLNINDPEGASVQVSIVEPKPKGFSIIGDSIVWEAADSDAGYYRYHFVATDGTNTDTLEIALSVLKPVQRAVKIAFPSQNLYEADNMFVAVEDWNTQQDELAITVRNLTGGDSIAITANRVDRGKFLANFQLSYYRRSVLPVTDGDTIEAVYTVGDTSYTSRAYYESTPQVLDNMAPDAITDLVVEAVSENNFMLIFTVPQDKRNSGQVTDPWLYDIRYNYTGIANEADYVASEKIELYQVGKAGQRDTVFVSTNDLLNAKDHHKVWFNIKAADGKYNYAAISNAASANYISDPYDLSATINDKYIVNLNWNGTQVLQGDTGFVRYRIVRKHNGKIFETVGYSDTTGYADTLRTEIVDGLLTYAVEGEYSTGKTPAAFSNKINLDRYTHLSLYIKEADASYKAFNVKLTPTNDYFAPVELTTDTAGYALLPNMVNTDYLLEVYYDNQLLTSDNVTISTANDVLNYMVTIPTVGTNDALQNASPISVYPNPASNLLTIDLGWGNGRILDYYLVSQTGRIVRLDEGMWWTREVNIKLNNVSAGMYTLVVKTSKANFTKQVVVVK